MYVDPGAAAFDGAGDVAGVAEAAGASDGAAPDDGAADAEGDDDGEMAGAGEQPTTIRTTRLVVASRASVLRIPSPSNGLEEGRPTGPFVTAKPVGLVTR